MSIQLSVGCKLLSNNSATQTLLHQLSSCPKPIAIAKLNCQCGTHQLAYHKLQTVVNDGKKGVRLFSVKFWLLDDQPLQMLLRGHDFNVIVDEEGSGGLDVGDAKNVIMVRQFSQIGQLLKGNVFEWQRRCALQHKLRKSHQKYRIASGRQQLKQMGVRYSEVRQRKEMRSMIVFFKFRSRVHIRMLGRYFNGWTIYRYQNQLEKIDKEIVQSSVLQLNSNRMLLGRCFQGWKRLASPTN